MISSKLFSMKITSDKEKEMKKILIGTLMLAMAISVCLPSKSDATPWSQQFYNDYASNAIYLWTNDSVLNPFTGITFDNAAVSGWNVFHDTGADLFFSGPVVPAKAGLFTITGAGSAYNFEWAEVLWNADFSGYTLLGAGHSSGSTTFNHRGDIVAPSMVTEPATMLLLGAGLIGLAGFGRKKLFKNA
jgi:hypothetical protein